MVPTGPLQGALRRPGDYPWYGLPIPVGNGQDLPAPPFWYGSERTVDFVPIAGLPPASPYLNPVFGGTVGVVQRAFFQTPIFDMRPDLKAALDYRPEATALPPTANVIAEFRRADGTFISATASSLLVYSIEAAHPADPRQIHFLNTRQEITADFYDGTEATALWWYPLGPPVRYWRVSVIFDWTDAVAAPPRFLGWGAAY